MSLTDDMEKTYCNPLPVPAVPIGRGVIKDSGGGPWWQEVGDPAVTRSKGRGPWWREYGDPTVIHFKGRWYLFPSGGMVWHSDDMRTWQFQSINLYDVGWAPSVVEKDGALYLTASWEGTRIWRATDPLGHWEDLGPIRDTEGKPFLWGDPMLFKDTDGALYAYYSIGPRKGIFGVPLRQDDVTRFAAPPKNLIAYNPEHVWERFGENNQDASISHLEGAFMLLHEGRYYLQYSAAGAEWRNYAVGCYVGAHPLGPFHYQKRNPILIQRGGMLNGCGHHTIVEGPDKKLWCFYQVLLRRFLALERRLAMDPVRFDADGNLFVDGPSEQPRLMDGTYPEGILPLSICQGASASSWIDGHEPEYAVDNYARTWWSAEGDCPQSLTVNLGAEFDVVAARSLFDETLVPGQVGPAVYQYLIEGICGDDRVVTLADRRASDVDCHIRYDTWPAQRVKHVRITLTHVPPGSRPGLMDFCVFGRMPASSGTL